MEPDTQLYGQLMTAAGAAGDLGLALGLHEEMQREGLQPCTVRWAQRRLPPPLKASCNRPLLRSLSPQRRNLPLTIC